jgi:peptide subunit release factor RF-3
VFQGELRGGSVALRRDGTYSFGNPWRTEETIVGSVGQRQFDAAYEYKECDTGSPQSCPGPCTIHARVVMRW